MYFMEIYLTSGLFNQFYSLEHTIVPVSIQAPCNHASITRLTIDYWVFLHKPCLNSFLTAYTGQTKGQGRFRFTSTRRRKAFKTMAFLFRGIFQPLRPPPLSKMPKACGWQLLTSFQIVLSFPNLDWSRMPLLLTCSANLREFHLSFLAA